jgi:NTP pyrophosphatase (non-canonical NTP hydrolase)
MELNKIIELQKAFDSKHYSKHKWNEIINDENIELLDHLIIALMGELGEFSNILKKINRGDFTLEEAKQELSEEITDMFIYIIKLIYQLNIDIEYNYEEKLYKNINKFKNYEIKE